MSFGFGVSDFLLVLNLCRNVCTTLKGAPAEYRECQSELNSVTTAIESLAKSADDPDSLLNRQGGQRKDDLTSIVNNCRGPLEKLQAIVNDHSRIEDSGSGKAVRAWDIICFGMTDLDAIRDKLNFHLLAINTFLVSLESFSMGNMERKLDKIYTMLKNSAIGNEIEFISSAASIMSTRSSVILSEIEVEGDEAWDGLKEALAAENISMLQIIAHREEIFQYVKTLQANDPTFAPIAPISGMARPVPVTETSLLIDLDLDTADAQQRFNDAYPSVFDRASSDGKENGAAALMRANPRPSVGEWHREDPISPPAGPIRQISTSASDTVADRAVLPNMEALTLTNVKTKSRNEDSRLSRPRFFKKHRAFTTDSSTDIDLTHSPKGSTPGSPTSSTSRSSSYVDTFRSLSSDVSTPMTSAPSSRRPTIRSSISDKSPRVSRRLSSFAKSLQSRPASGSMYQNPFSGAY